MWKSVLARTFLIAAAVAILALWTAALAGFANPLGLSVSQSSAPRADTNELAMRVIVPPAAQDTHHGVTVRIVEAGFSSSETTVLLEVAGLPPGLSLEQFSHNTTVDVAGFVGGVEVLRSEGVAASSEGSPRALLMLGPAADVEKPVVLSVTWAGEEPGSAFAPTTWRVSFVPGASAGDPVDTFVQLDRPIKYGPMTVSVKGAHISSSRVSVYYDMLMEPGVAADPVGGVANLIYPDGEKVLGVGAAEFIETLPDGSLKADPVDPLANAPYAVSFPLVRGPEEPFLVEFGKFIIGVADRREYAVPADGTVAVAQMDGDTFELSAIQDRDDNITIRVQRQPGVDPGGFLINTIDDATLRDELGTSYEFLSGETGFRKTEVTEPAADRSIMVFGGPLDPRARLLYLTVPDSAKVVGPADGGQLSLR